MGAMRRTVNECDCERVSVCENKLVRDEIEKRREGRRDEAKENKKDEGRKEKKIIIYYADF